MYILLFLFRIQACCVHQPHGDVHHGGALRVPHSTRGALGHLQRRKGGALGTPPQGPGLPLPVPEGIETDALPIPSLSLSLWTPPPPPPPPRTWPTSTCTIRYRDWRPSDTFSLSLWTPSQGPGLPVPVLEGIETWRPTETPSRALSLSRYLNPPPKDLAYLYLYQRE